MKKTFLLLIILLFSLNIFARGFLGIIVNDTVTNELKLSHGVIVLKVVENSPADLAGINSGDLILKINGKKIISDIDISEILYEKKIADKLDFKILNTEDLVSYKTVTLADSQKFQLNSFYYNNPVHFFLNINYIALNPQLKRHFGTNSGIFVTEKFNNLENVLQAGDILLEVNGLSINNGHDFYSSIGSYSSGKKIELDMRIKRGSEVLERTIDIVKNSDYFSFEYKSNEILLNKNGRTIRIFNYFKMRDLINEIEQESNIPLSEKIRSLEQEINNLKREID